MLPIRRRSSIAVRSQSSAMAHFPARVNAACPPWRAMRDNRHDGSRGHRRRRSGGCADRHQPAAAGLRRAHQPARRRAFPALSAPAALEEADDRRDGRRAHLHTLRRPTTPRAGWTLCWACGSRAIDRERPRRAVRRRHGRSTTTAACSAPARGRAGWTLPGGDLPGVFYLRTLEDCERIKAAVATGARAVIIGGGYIGLEIAASLSKWQCEVTVLEALERVLNRVVALPVSDFFAAEHARHGVAIVTGAAVASARGRRQGGARALRRRPRVCRRHRRDRRRRGAQRRPRARRRARGRERHRGRRRSAAPAIPRSSPRATSPITRTTCSTGACGWNRCTMRWRRPRRSPARSRASRRLMPRCPGSGRISTI